VGNDAGAQAWIGAGTQQVNLGGRTMLPGFIDSHAHPDAALDDLYEVNVYSLHGSMKVYQKQIKAFAARHPDLAIIQGSGWTLDTCRSSGRRVISSTPPSRIAPLCCGT